MFIETHNSNKDIKLTFVKSANVQAYPCSRRRSELLTKGDGSEFYFPFDPEARLNTEANNRKISGLNGYTQTYIQSWGDGKLVLSLAGYLFTITLPSGYSTPADFGSKAISQTVLNDADAECIYANILIEDAYLYTGFTDYYTSVLRNQSDYDSGPAVSLDLLKGELTNSTKSEECYFSGLSFSTTPLTANGRANYVINTYDVYPIVVTRSTNKVKQTLVSLCILEKNGDTWQLYQPALLPKIEHGDTADSIVVTGNALMKSTLDVKEKLTVKNDAKNALIEADQAKIPNIESTNLIKAKNIGTNQNKVENIITAAANIGTLTAGTVNANDIQQKIGEGDDTVYYDVPVIFLESKQEGDKTSYQLQISRVNSKN